MHSVRARAPEPSWLGGPRCRRRDSTRRRARRRGRLAQQSTTRARPARGRCRSRRGCTRQSRAAARSRRRRRRPRRGVVAARGRSAPELSATRGTGRLASGCVASGMPQSEGRRERAQEPVLTTRASSAAPRASTHLQRHELPALGALVLNVSPVKHAIVHADSAPGAARDTTSRLLASARPGPRVRVVGLGQAAKHVHHVTWDGGRAVVVAPLCDGQGLGRSDTIRATRTFSRCAFDVYGPRAWPPSRPRPGYRSIRDAASFCLRARPGSVAPR